MHDQIGHQLKQVDELLKETIREHTQRLLQVEQQQNQTYKVVDNLQVQQEIYQVQTIASIKCIKAQQEEYHTKTDAAIGNLLNKAGQTWIPSEEGSDVFLFCVIY